MYKVTNMHVKHLKFKINNTNSESIVKQNYDYCKVNIVMTEAM